MTRLAARISADRAMQAAIDQVATANELSPTEVVALLTSFTARYAAALLRLVDASESEGTEGATS